MKLSALTRALLDRRRARRRLRAAIAAADAEIERAKAVLRGGFFVSEGVAE